MKLSEAFDIVSQFHEIGFVDWAERLPDKPWSRITDELETAILAPGITEEKISIAAQRYVDQMRPLFKLFKELNPTQAKMSFLDAFIMGEKRFNEAMSVQNVECYQCGSKTNLSNEAYGSPLRVRVVCQNHKQK